MAQYPAGAAAHGACELARLFALDKFIFWRVLSFWRSDRDLPPHITTRKTTAPYYYW